MAAKHTPGPWAADAEDMQLGADDIFTVSIWAAGPEGDRPLVATISAFALLSETRGATEYVTPDAPSEDKLAEAKANAHLIAAAPELLAALQELCALEADGMQAAESAIESWERARAALAKATGGAL